ncbi:MAG: Clp protease N-terminal domain-containing protein, partial [Verrucomicrobiota bacterium]
MNPNQFTIKLQEALQSAQELAAERYHSEFSSLHLLAALLAQPDGLTRPVLNHLDVPVETLASEVDQALSRQASVEGSPGQQIYLSNDLRNVIATAESRRKEMGDDYTSVEHALLALASEGSTAVKDLLRSHQLSEKTLREAIDTVRGSQKVTDQDPEGKYQALEKYCTDLTAIAREGKIDP